MEVLDAIMSMVANYGFPIAACVAMFWYMNKEREGHAQEMKEMTEAHHAEVKEMTEALNSSTLKTTDALNKNTAVIERLLDKVG